ncbi:unnamed protein product [Anisakis simplex]|uniref:Nucleoporin n=1 Tax=Anisakis simplex TaxID=6269 RepID=A0A0M3JAP3_ANISI|nr:unnamed protein product [Anisakis simplex]
MGNANAPRTSSLFGSIMSSSTSSTQQQQQSTPSFSFSAALANPQQSTGSVFGAKPVVTGATSTFGGAPTFGSKPTFGARSPLASAFSQAVGVQPTQATVPSSGGIFSAFAHSGVSSGFGALAAASQQQGQKSSLFGGSGFGSLVQQQQQQQQKPSVFGGSTFGAQANTQRYLVVTRFSKIF